ncbi:ADR357Cp [Eremothecium gossypii ATCC 10895]|uniref:DNA polymerase gamma n=1 Tax=Eremothecium gossypii (strain ATCC 10895 / CBS 109.51 / FGSC 9923 / NRRL Y-1056) TaxID=284811 RepID=Q759C0_EREGS|nr:ADR357Cp [Eremothecium gossypii ATCC 10895]AAS52277.1 ADR357Cp [Eremothecium gossypii ATCC 10895]AEY96575.1 FADR357Cp [Eremothecium gossypii FDAG1]
MIKCGLTRLKSVRGASVRGYSDAARKQARNDTKWHEEPRLNPVGIQYMSHSLHKQLFGASESMRRRNLDEAARGKLVKWSKLYLKLHGLLGSKTSISEPISFELPQLQGTTLDEHFQRLGHFASDPYLSLCENKSTEILPRPQRWLRKAGWYRYAPGREPEAVASPLEDIYVFDVECLYKISDYPTLAVALSDKAWYLWCSPYICGEDNFVHLIPLNTMTRPQVIIGHNVGYDRSKVLEEYNLAPSKAFFMDTMSLHISSSGMCSRQRPFYLKNQKTKQQENDGDLDYELNEDLELGNWYNLSTMNSLRDVAKLHCNINLEKTLRDSFEALDKQEVIDKFQQLVDYCSTDVETTSKVFDKVYPLFREQCPHPVSFGALRFLSNCILPVQPKMWKQYIDGAETLYQNARQAIEEKIITIIEEIVKLKDKPEVYENDPWYKQLDWTISPLKLTKKGVPAKRQKMPGYPAWYRSLFTGTDKKPNITIRSRLIPLFFKLTWEGYPVVWNQEHGWCFEVPDANAGTFLKKNYAIANSPDFDRNVGYTAFRIPHPSSAEQRTTTLFSKPYMHFMDKNVLQSEYSLAREALKINSSGSYWTAARERIKTQHVVSKEDFPDQFAMVDGTPSRDDQVGAIIPKIIPMGTVTRRAVENTWLTASNAKANRIGSELKTKIVAPEGYSFVGADVDSEELWIASLIGDSVFNIHGGTAIGYMCLEGTKDAGTDMHTKTASILGCSRNEAKIFNYGRIYGAGVRFAAQLLKQFNPTLSEEQTRATAERLYEATKGKTYHSKIFKKFWFGGSESILFNKLEHIAEQDQPRTPVLGAGITVSLLKRNLGKDTFLPSRINWAIQSSGVDYLHLLFCSMHYLIEKYRLRARVCISIHDELRYLVANEDRYRVALALQVANLWTRAIFCEQIGIDDLPQNCAFFSAVDIDHVLRKEVDMDCVTPSNQTPVPHGERVTITDLLARPDAALNNPNPAVNVADYPVVQRQPVLAYYNSTYDAAFLNFFLDMQIQDSKASVADIEKHYREFLLRDAFSADRAETVTMADYLAANGGGKLSINAIDTTTLAPPQPQQRKPASRRKPRVINRSHRIAIGGPAAFDAFHASVDLAEEDADLRAAAITRNYLRDRPHL